MAEPASAPQGFTIDDLLRPADRRSQIRRTPQLAREALKLVWIASRKNLLFMIGINLLSSLATAGQLLIAQRLMNALVDVTRGADPSVLYGPLALFTLAAIVLAVLGGIATYQQRLVVELTGRYAFARIVEASTSVEYARFESPEFYDQLQRARARASTGSPTWSRASPSSSAHCSRPWRSPSCSPRCRPVLLILVVRGRRPALIAAVQNSRESYAFEYAMTPRAGSARTCSRC